MNKQEIIVLFRKYDDGSITEQEQIIWEAWCKNASLEEFNGILREAFPARIFPDRQLHAGRTAAIEAAIEKATNRDNGGRVIQLQWKRWAAAAILLAAGAGWWQVKHAKKIYSSGHQEMVASIQPGRQGAVLTLASGQQVLLDSVNNGVIAAQLGTNVLMDSGRLKYDVQHNDKNAVAWNTISTPRSRQFTLILPDGSALSMNAASTVKFPVAFNSSKREITVSGEVYLEVAPNSNQPFFVNLPNNTTIQVLGTSFNISAYTDDKQITTTLLTGAISINTGNQQTVIKPGQQALVNENGKLASVNTHPDLTKVLAWKNRLFNFDDANIADVMKQLSRWYDIEVVYQGKIPDIHFGGKLSMDMTLEGVLKALEDEEVHYKLEGRQLTILP